MTVRQLPEVRLGAVCASCAEAHSKNGGAFTSAMGTASNGDNVTVQALSSASPATTVTAMLTIGNVHGNFAVKTRVADLTPDPVVFAAVTNADLSTLYTSNSVTLGGMDAGQAAAVSVSGGQYSVNGGAYTSAAGTAMNGDTVAVQATSSASFRTRVAATLKVGTRSGVFGVTTKTH